MDASLSPTVILEVPVGVLPVRVGQSRRDAEVLIAMIYIS